MNTSDKKLTFYTTCLNVNFQLGSQCFPRIMKRVHAMRHIVNHTSLLQLLMKCVVVVTDPV